MKCGSASEAAAKVFGTPRKIKIRQCIKDCFRRWQSEFISKIASGADSRASLVPEYENLLAL